MKIDVFNLVFRLIQNLKRNPSTSNTHYNQPNTRFSFPIRNIKNKILKLEPPNTIWQTHILLNESYKNITKTSHSNQTMSAIKDNPNLNPQNQNQREPRNSKHKRS